MEYYKNIKIYDSEWEYFKEKYSLQDLLFDIYTTLICYETTLRLYLK